MSEYISLSYLKVIKKKKLKKKEKKTGKKFSLI